MHSKVLPRQLDRAIWRESESGIVYEFWGWAPRVPLHDR